MYSLPRPGLHIVSHLDADQMDGVPLGRFKEVVLLLPLPPGPGDVVMEPDGLYVVVSRVKGPGFATSCCLHRLPPAYEVLLEVMES